MVIKKNPFSDGNKRIGAFLFIWYLRRNRTKKPKGGALQINPSALTALALLIAQSDPADKARMIMLTRKLSGE